MKYQTKQITKCTQSGFTLIELIIALAIGIITMTIAIPSFLTTIQNSHLTTETNKLVADINLARSEAIKRSADVWICGSANPSAAAPVCAGSTTWTTGWLLFIDDNGDNAFAAADDTLIRIGNAQASGSSVKFISTANTLTYTAEGILSTGSATFVVAICDDRGTSEGRQVQVNPTGRPRLVKTIGSCTVPVAA